MAVTPLLNRPQPPNGVPHRGMFVWVGGTPATDPLDTDTDQQALINFLDDPHVGVNVLFLDMWRTLGGSNWTNAKRDRIHQFLDVAHRSGVKVYALAGNVDYGTNHAWVMDNIVEPLMASDAMATSPSKRFDGVLLDVEYWTDEVNYPPSTNLPGLCRLVRAIKERAPHYAVGLFAAFFLKDGDGSMPPVSYNGKTAQDGEHMMEVSDFIVVGAYRDHASVGGAEIGPGQIALFQPWYDYAKEHGKACGLYCGSETTNVTPDHITYFGTSKAAMEVEHITIANTFKSTENSAFLGQAIHSYDGFRAMS